MSSEDIFINPHADSHFSSEVNSREAAAIRTFHSSLPDYAPTPLIPLSALSSELECEIYLKDESSRLGLPSFKILGASWGAFRALCQHIGREAQTTTVSDLKAYLTTLSEPITLTAATDGNHGRAVAYFARLVGCRCTIRVPRTLPAATVALIEQEGACVVRSKGNYDDAVREAASESDFYPDTILVQDTAWEGYETVPAWIVEGYGTMMAETQMQLAFLESSGNFSSSVNTASVPESVVLTPVGVGSLASAVVSHFAGSGPIIAVEPATAACLQTSLRNGHPVSVSTPGTIMSGMDCGTVSSLAWPLLSKGVDVCVKVSDQEAHEAVTDLEEYGIKAGPCGAAPIAALKKALKEKEVRQRVRGKKVVVLCTEGEREYDIPK